ncbi:AAA family ATPase [Cohnella suwonensis]|uniref:AAA family ATPase n=1 Tax=Cohnella suwonensis TaxID=696072 RepID=A0ABW0LYT8_9BACL
MHKGLPLTMPSQETASLAYKNDWEYIGERLGWLDHRIAMRLHIQETLEPTSESDVFEATDPRDLLARIEQYERRLAARTEESGRQGCFLPLPHLSNVFGLSPLEEKIVFVCLAPECDRKYESLFELLQPGPTGRQLTPDVIATIVSDGAEERREVVRALRPEGMLRRFFLNAGISPKNGTLLAQPIALDERIVRYVLDSGDGIPESMADYAKLAKPGEELAPLLGNQAVQSKLRRWLANRSVRAEAADAPIILSLWGEKGAGKKTHALHMARYFDEPLLIVDMAKLLRSEPNADKTLQNVFREATIGQAILVLDRFRPGDEDVASAATAEETLDRLSEMKGIVFLLSDRPCRTIDRRNRIDLEIQIAPLQDEERTDAWRKLAEPYAMDPELDWDALAGRFLFTPGQMARSLRSAAALSEWKRDGEEIAPIGWADMIEAGYGQLNHGLGAKSKRLSPKNRWDDLVLPEAQKEKLRHACNHIQYKHTVYGSWGFNKKLSYGTGISLLFSGPPGTGKTMASEIVAKELDMEIYKIDLSQIISKYIGETEKNLSEIFDEAQASYAVLFFDEADALFGKRSEVKDSHDKNANTEVAYLLQKMEEYRGISILATNYLQNMDEAFLRRINYVIRFPFPDEKQRETIWKHIYPAQTPLDPDIDFPFLARKLQMAGGSIKNIALTSAFLASGKRERVGMRHIFKAYQYELDKTNRALTRGDLGEYDYLYEELNGGL